MAVRQVLEVLFEVLFVHARVAARSVPKVCGSQNRLHFRPLFAYYGHVPSSCKVGFTDGAGVTHSVAITASSMYEAAVLGLAELKRCGFAMAIAGPATRLTVAVESPATTHELSVGRLQAWLDASGKTPREQAIKVRLRQLLGGI